MTNDKKTQEFLQELADLLEKWDAELYTHEFRTYASVGELDDDKSIKFPSWCLDADTARKGKSIQRGACDEMD